MAQAIDQLKNTNGGSTDRRLFANVGSVINDIVSKTDRNGNTDFSMSMLKNGSISMNLEGISTPLGYGLYNTDQRRRAGSFAIQSRDEEGVVSYMLNSWGSKEFEGSIARPTVGNLQSTFVHEAFGHLYRGFEGGETKSHAKALALQMNHSSWSKATPMFRNWIKELYQKYK